MDNFWKDVRHGARLLFKSPGISAVSILALMLGIGLSTTMFSIVYGALYRGLPFEEADQILHVENSNPVLGFNSMEVPIHDYLDWRAQQRSFEHLAAFYSGTVNVSGTERADRYDGSFVTANTFSLLRVAPILGRAFREGEDRPGAEPVIIPGYDLWQTRFNGDPAVLGTSIRANGEPMTIVGVMPPKFQFPANQEIWLPLRLDALKLLRGRGQTLEVVGRLRDGVTLDDAVMDLSNISKRLELEHAATNKDLRPVLKHYTDEYIGDEPRALLLTMLGAVFFVLLIACTNVANLLLGRAILRSKEVGIRTALGASRWRLVTQFLTEAMVLSMVGALLGLIVAWIGIRLFNNALVDAQPPFWISIKLDWAALAFVLALTLVTSLFSGTIPALQASRSGVTDVLKDESRGASSFRLGKISRALVVFEIALSCGLLVAAGLTIKSVVKLRNVDFGFSTDNLFTARIGLPEVTYPDTLVQTQFVAELQAPLASLPNVGTVTFASSLPGLGEGNWTFGIEGVQYERDQDYPAAPRAAIATNYFSLLDIKVAQGRGFTEMDRLGNLRVAVVNQSFARKHFPNADALGRRVRFGNSKSTSPWVTIVGIVPDALAGSLDDNVRPDEAIYVPLAQNPKIGRAHV